MDVVRELALLAEAHGGIIETKVAERHDISRTMLFALHKKEKLRRIAQGQYIFPDDIQDELLSLSRRSKKIVFSHETALFLHGFSDRTPFEHTITIPSAAVVSPEIRAECKVYYIKPELFELGKTVLKTTQGNKVPAYDLERTVCDLIRSRSRVGTETFLHALKLYASSPAKDLHRLYGYAKQLHVANVLRRYLEVLL